MTKWKPLDIIVVVLTVTICGCLGSAVIKPLMTGTPLTDAKAQLVATMIASATSIVSMYVGAKLNAIRESS